MRFSLSSTGLQEWNGDVLAVGLPQGDVEATATDLEQRLQDHGGPEAAGVQGPAGDQLVITPLASARSAWWCWAWVTLKGSMQTACAAAARHKAAIGWKAASTQLPWAGIDAAESARISVKPCGSAFKDQRFRKEPDPRRIPEVLELIGIDPAAASGFAAVNATCAGVELARELVAALNVVTPAALAETAAGIANDHGLELWCSSAATVKPKAWAPFGREPRLDLRPSSFT